MKLLELFLAFLKIGAFTFGGGYAMVPLIQQEALSHGWISSEELVDFIAVSESTPGPLAVNMATFVGIKTAGVFGALVATLGVVLPSFIIILVIAHFMDKFRKSVAIKGIMSGIKPCVLGLIAAALLSIGHTVLFPGGFTFESMLGTQFLACLAIFTLSAVLSFKKLHPVFVILIAAGLGIAAGYTLGL